MYDPLAGMRAVMEIFVEAVEGGVADFLLQDTAQTLRSAIKGIMAVFLIGQFNEMFGYGQGLAVKAAKKKFQISSNLSPSKRPRSLSLRWGITRRAMNESVIKGAARGEPRDLARRSIAV